MSSVFVRQLGEGPPLLLIHGLMATGEMFEPVLDAFAEHHTLIVSDLRGHGRSSYLPGPYTVEKLAEDLAWLLEDLGIESADVLGYSQGGAVAQQFTRRYPHRTRRLVLACTYAYNMLSLRERLEGALLPWLVRVLGPRRLATLFVRPGIGLGGGRPLTPETARWFRDIMASNERSLMVEAVRQMKAFDSREWLDQISCPTLVLCGSEDTGVPMHHARMLAQGIRSSQLRVIEGAGHALLWTHPEELIEQTEQWFSSEARQHLREEISMETSTSQPAATPEEVRDVHRTTCCIVGGGPGGAVLALLLARKGVSVTLLEAHPNFDREFRGDTIHPSVMELMDQLGLADRLLELRHNKIRNLQFQSSTGPFVAADLSRLKTKFPYITLMPQTNFLEFIVEEAKRYPNFRLVMNARVRELVEEDGVVRGIRYEGHDGKHEVRAVLTVGADGRGSRVRRLAGFEPIKTSPPMDVLWFKLPREPGDPEGLIGRFGGGHGAVALDRFDYWQAGYIILKGTFSELRHEGIESLQRSYAELVPELADRVRHLEDWKQVSLLSVESSRCPRWYRPGMLLIGDAAHVMSPVGGVGINYAIQDAVAAANVLGGPLKKSQSRLRVLDVGYLAAVQRRRELPTRFIQAAQALVQNQIVANALRSEKPFAVPLPLRLMSRVPVLRDIPARIIAFGLWPVHVKD